MVFLGFVRRSPYCPRGRASILSDQSTGAPMTDIPHPFTPEDALIAVMIAVSASDENIRTSELVTIEAIVNHLPVFARYDPDRIKNVSQAVFDLFSEEDGLDALFGLVRANLPEPLWETAYALACDVAAADGRLQESELRLLEEMRYELDIDRLHAAAIERGARARHMEL
ncbi:MAG TPA: 2-dehydro-3-deoxyphosphooctonate aldolase [Aliiroseovarius sp.]|nr:2-dehydro-3-deoxyphosphooctonate aldolase [Aliiroseovarius sp.]